MLGVPTHSKVPPQCVKWSKTADSRKYIDAVALKDGHQLPPPCIVSPDVRRKSAKTTTPVFNRRKDKTFFFTVAFFKGHPPSGHSIIIVIHTRQGDDGVVGRIPPLFSSLFCFFLIKSVHIKHFMRC